MAQSHVPQHVVLATVSLEVLFGLDIVFSLYWFSAFALSKRLTDVHRKPYTALCEEYCQEPAGENVE